eukprot:CAMPEP_0179294264 /NCGR_PEP_ID=MMETSP0797-20121207/43806_1 /TAXON_ID=47934 /ORGANISM="Dinophysis acuminata, Strain DAEP01" /LENGTH=93 /DNA_ID=CAMNT_0021003451 /DNA_START=78 /DNA_END=359 /DNA_ORIENTATION=-
MSKYVETARKGVQQQNLFPNRRSFAWTQQQMEGDPSKRDEVPVPIDFTPDGTITWNFPKKKDKYTGAVVSNEFTFGHRVVIGQGNIEIIEPPK